MNQKPLALIIDDHEPIREILKLGLTELAGFKVVEATDGPSGIYAASEHEPDLILLDWMMPRMNGIEVLEILKSRHETKKTPVFMLTRNDLMGEVEQAVEAGAVGYFTKPINIRELCTRIKTSFQHEITNQKGF